MVPPLFSPYMGHPPWKIDEIRHSLEAYNASSQLVSYNLYLQEQFKRLHENRQDTLQIREGTQILASEPMATTSLVPRKNDVIVPHALQLAQCSPELSKDKSLTTTSSLGESLGNPYNIGRKVFPCPQCRYTTDRRNNLKRHMLTMHQTCPKLLECCGILFSTKASLREHAMIFHYHGYTCFYCGRRFCRKALLKRHLSVHNGQKDFVCTICDYATSHKSNLERHRKVHMRQDDASDDMTSSLTPSSTVQSVGEMADSGARVQSNMEHNSAIMEHTGHDNVIRGRMEHNIAISERIEHDIAIDTTTSSDSEDEEINVQSD